MRTLTFDLNFEELRKDVESTVLFERPDLATIEITGADARDFLHRMTSQSFKTIQPGESLFGAFLNGNATVVALFTAKWYQERCLLVLQKSALASALAFIEKFHFGEEIQYREIHLDWYEVRGISYLSERAEFIVLPARKGLHPGFWVARNDHNKNSSERLREVHKFVSESVKTLKVLDSSLGPAVLALENIPEDRLDVSDSNILLELDAGEFVHRNKGCYPGQEVIERIFTYGNVAKKIVALENDSSGLPPSFTSAGVLTSGADGKKVGSLTSLYIARDKMIGFATILRLSVLAEATYQTEELSLRLKNR